MQTRSSGVESLESILSQKLYWSYTAVPHIWPLIPGPEWQPGFVQDLDLVGTYTFEGYAQLPFSRVISLSSLPLSCCWILEKLHLYLYLIFPISGNGILSLISPALGILQFIDQGWNTIAIITLKQLILLHSWCCPELSQ